MKIATTKHRILQYIDYKCISKQTFFKETGLKRGFLDADKLETSIPDTFIATIIAIYPEINLTWLITGNGEMLNNNQSQVKTQTNAEIGNTAIIAELKERITELKERVSDLKDMIAAKDELIAIMRKQLRMKQWQDTPPAAPDADTVAAG